MENVSLVARVEVNPILSCEDIKAFWQTYDESFTPIRDRNPCRQHFHREEFVTAMKDPEFIKLIGYEENRMVFFAMGTENLDKIPWIYREFYDKTLPMYVNSRFYVPAIYIPLTQQGLGYSDQLCRSIQSYMRSKGLQLVLFDHGSAPPNSELVRIILRVSGTELVDGKPIGSQLYNAVLTTLE